MNGRLWKPFLVVVLLAALQALAFVVYRHVEHTKTAAPVAAFEYERLVPGQRAPELELERMDGSSRRLAELGDRWVLVHFWATWCPPCREELPGLLELSQQLSVNGRFELVAVAVNEPWEAIHPFFGGKTPASVVRDRADAHKRFGVSTLPDTFLVAPGGTLVLRFSGARAWRSEDARALLTREMQR